MPLGLANLPCRMTPSKPISFAVAQNREPFRFQLNHRLHALRSSLYGGNKAVEREASLSAELHNRATQCQWKPPVCGYVTTDAFWQASDAPHGAVDVKRPACARHILVLQLCTAGDQRDGSTLWPCCFPVLWQAVCNILYLLPMPCCLTCGLHLLRDLVEILQAWFCVSTSSECAVVRPYADYLLQVIMQDACAVRRG